MAGKKNTDLKITITEGAALINALIDALNENTAALKANGGAFVPDENVSAESQQDVAEVVETPETVEAATVAAPVQVPLPFPVAAPVQAAPSNQYQAPAAVPYAQNAAPAWAPQGNATYQAPVVPPAPVNAAPVAVAPNAAPEGVTLNDLSRAGAWLCERGYLAQCLDILRKYGVDTVESLKPADYPAVAAELRALGAQI